MRPLMCLVACAMCSALCSCANPGPVLVGGDTYLLTRTDSAGAFANTAKLKAGVIRDANAFAASKGKVAVPVSMSEQRPGIGGGFPSFDYQFKLVDKDDAAARANPVMEQKP